MVVCRPPILTVLHTFQDIVHTAMFLLIAQQNHKGAA